MRRLGKGNGGEGRTVDELGGLRALEGRAVPGAEEAGAGLELRAEALEGRGGVAVFSVGLPGEEGDFGDFRHLGG